VTPSPVQWIVGSGGLPGFKVRFSESVVVPEDAVTLWTTSGGPLTPALVFYNEVDSTLLVTLPEPVIEDHLTAVIEYTIRDLAGNALDGEISSPRSPSLPSGNGQAGGQAVLQFTVLQGDVDRSGAVDATDGAIIKASLGRKSTDPAADPRADLNGDGVINVLDVTIFKQGQGGFLPPTDGLSPTVTEVLPPPTSPLTGPLSEIELKFSEAISPLRYQRASALHLIDGEGGLHIPTTASFAADGLSATFQFIPPVASCAKYALNITSALADASGELLQTPAPSPVLSGMVPPQAPTLDEYPTLTNQQILTLTGSAPQAVEVRVVGPEDVYVVPVTGVGGGRFSVPVELPTDFVHTISLSSVSPCGITGPAVSAIITRDTSGPFINVDFPQPGQQVTTASITVLGRVGDEFSGADGVTVTVNGLSAEVSTTSGNNGTFVASDIPLTQGQQQISIVATDSLGNSRTKTLAIERIVVPEGTPTIEVVGGDGQSAPVYADLPDPISVQLRLPNGNPMANKVVTFTVDRNNGVLFPSAGRSEDGDNMLQVFTDSQGYARARWRLGSTAGAAGNRVAVVSQGLVGTVYFSATGTHAPASRILIGEGNNQKAETGGPLPQRLIAYVTDGDTGNPVAGVPVVFTVTGGDGSFSGGETSTTVPTGNNGRAETPFTLGLAPGINTVEATFDGNPGLPATFNATGVARVEGQPTTFTGIVLDNANRPIGGALATLTVTLDYAAGADTVILGPVQSDVEGRFTFDSSVLPPDALNTVLPGGPAKVLVSGVFATTLAGEPITREWMFPYVGYEIVLVENAANTLQDPVWLPELDPANDVVYDGTKDVVLTIAGIEGLEFKVKAGSVTREDGTRPTPENPETLRLNQVHFDEVPMPLPNGNAYPFAWTLQPKNARFDPPIQVTLPNLSGLEPGAIAEIQQWNNTVAEFQTMGTGKVSPDGSVITTEPGSGITVAGWGAALPPPPPTAEIQSCKDDPAHAEQVAALEAKRDAALARAQARFGEAWAWAQDYWAQDALSLPLVGTRIEIIRNAWGIAEVAFVSARNLWAVTRAACLIAILNPEEPFSKVPCGIGINATLAAFGVGIAASATVIITAASFIDDFEDAEGLWEALRDLDEASYYLVEAAESQKDIATICAPIAIERESDRAIQQLKQAVDRTGNELNRIRAELEPTLAEAKRVRQQAEQLRAQIEAWAEELRQKFGDYINAAPDPQALAGQMPLVDECELVLPDGSVLELDLPPGVECDEEILDKIIPDNVVLQAQQASVDSGNEAIGNLEVAGELADAAARDAGAELTSVSLAVADVVALFDFSKWRVEAGGRVAIPDSAGTFTIDNIPLSPTPVRVYAQRLGSPGVAPLYAASEFLLIDDQDDEPVLSVPLEAGPNPIPRAVALTPLSESNVLAPGTSVQLSIRATMSDGTVIDASTLADGTTYQASNPSVLGVMQDGLIVVGTIGTAFVAATNEGVITVKRFDVADEVIQTTVTGVVLLPNGLPAAGASVTSLPVGGSATAAADGSFSITLSVPADTAALSARATLVGFRASVGSSVGIVAGGFTDAGVIQLAPPLSGPLFAARQDYLTNIGPTSVSIGDLNGDGDQDLVVGHRFNSSVSVLLGHGDGTFAPRQDVVAGSSPRSVSIGDLDGDGDQDLAAANIGSNTVSVLLGTGDGTFAAKQDFVTGFEPSSVSIGYLDGNAALDLVVANSSGNSVSVLLGHGDGTFATRQDIAMGVNPYSVSIGDLDGDRDQDLVVTNLTANSVGVLLGNGDGTFAPRQGFATGVNPYSVSIGDLDGDGVQDLAAANSGSNSVSVLLGKGDGTFAARQDFATGLEPYSVSIGDLDGDGVQDLAVANSGSNSVSVLLGNGDGTFATRQDFATGPGQRSVAIGDLDGDGDQDLAVTCAMSHFYPQDNWVSVLLNRTIEPAIGAVAANDLGQLIPNAATDNRVVRNVSGRQGAGSAQATRMRSLVTSQVAIGAAPTSTVTQSSQINRRPSEHSGISASVGAVVVLDERAAELAPDSCDLLANAAGQHAETRIDPALGVPRAVMIDADGMVHPIPTLGGPTGSAAAINDRGDVAGFADTADGRVEGFVWRASTGQVTSIGTLEGDRASAAALWLGDAVVLGNSSGDAGVGRAVLWTPDGQLIDLNSLVKNSPGLRLTRPRVAVPSGRLVLDAIDAAGKSVRVQMQLRLVETLAGDVDWDGEVSATDMIAAVRLIQWSDPTGDFNGDGRVNASDFNIIAQQIGRTAKQLVPPEEAK